jgi:hypothetical protein
MQNLWSSALKICKFTICLVAYCYIHRVLTIGLVNSKDRDWKQSLLKDLDNDDGLFSQQHIKNLLNTQAQPGQHKRFVTIVQLFLLVITHSAMIDALSVNTYVGNLYNFVSGANGTRAILFFQHICELVIELRTDSNRLLPLKTLDTTLIAISTTLSKLLQREPRARYNKGLLDLIHSLKTTAHSITETESGITSHILSTQAKDLYAVVAQAKGLLVEGEETGSKTSLDLIIQSKYPRNIVVPRDCHNNNKTDITNMSILPT